MSPPKPPAVRSLSTNALNQPDLVTVLPSSPSLSNHDVLGQKMFWVSAIPSYGQMRRQASSSVNYCNINCFIVDQGWPDISHVDQYQYALSRAQLKASSTTSALLAGFAMVALVELQYDEQTPHSLLIILAIITALLVSVHLLALMLSTCMLPHVEATGPANGALHLRLKPYIELAWFFSTCLGLALFLVEIGIIFFVKFGAIHFELAAYVTTAVLVPVFLMILLFSFLFYKNLMIHHVERLKSKLHDMQHFMEQAPGGGANAGSKAKEEPNNNIGKTQVI